MRQILKRMAAWGLQGDMNAAMKYNFRDRIRKLGREGKIRTVYDIGAHLGNWARGMKRLLPEANFYLWEANPANQSHLAKSGFSYFLVALSRNEGRKTFYSADSTGDSFYRENSGLTGFPGWRETETATTDLDSFVRRNVLPDPDWVKLDVQGSELDVLAGGRRVFSNAAYLLCEVPVVAYNVGAPCFSDYLEALAAIGFQPSGLVESHWIPQKNGKTIMGQLDLFFERI